MLDHSGDRTKITVQQIDDGTRGELLAYAAELLDVGKEDRERAALSLIGTAADQPADDARIDEFAESVFDALARAQLLDHPIEGQGELTNLVACVNRHRYGLRSGLDGPRGREELAQAADHLGRSHGADAEADPAGEEEQGKTQICIEPLAREHHAGRLLGEMGDVEANLGEVRAKVLGELGEAERGGPCLVAPAICQRDHRGVADRQKLL